MTLKKVHTNERCNERIMVVNECSRLSYVISITREAKRIVNLMFVGLFVLVKKVTHITKVTKKFRQRDIKLRRKVFGHYIKIFPLE